MGSQTKKDHSGNFSYFQEQFNNLRTYDTEVREAIAELKDRSRAGTLQEYHEPFQSLLDDGWVDEELAISLFLGGLRAKIRDSVSILNPQTLHNTYLLAKLQEFIYDRDEFGEDVLDQTEVRQEQVESDGDYHGENVSDQIVIEQEHGEFNCHYHSDVENEDSSQQGQTAIPGEHRSLVHESEAECKEFGVTDCSVHPVLLSLPDPSIMSSIPMESVTISTPDEEYKQDDDCILIVEGQVESVNCKQEDRVEQGLSETATSFRDPLLELKALNQIMLPVEFKQHDEDLTADVNIVKWLRLPEGNVFRMFIPIKQNGLKLKKDWDEHVRSIMHQEMKLSGLHEILFPRIHLTSLEYLLLLDVERIYLTTTKFFIDVVNSLHSYDTEPRCLAMTLQIRSEESGATYSTSKISHHLFTWAKEVVNAYYYECALTNGILSIQRRWEPSIMIFMLLLGRGVPKAISYHVWEALKFATEFFLSSWPIKNLKEIAFEKIRQHIHCEDEYNRSIIFFCVEKPLMILACWAEGPTGEAFKRHLSYVIVYVWNGEDGTKMQSLGSQKSQMNKYEEDQWRNGLKLLLRHWSKPIPAQSSWLFWVEGRLKGEEELVAFVLAIFYIFVPLLVRLAELVQHGVVYSSLHFIGFLFEQNNMGNQLIETESTFGGGGDLQFHFSGANLGDKVS